ncbi:FtsX-like permease family protein [Streptomyces sp. NRRL S-87]|uniref:FtsX-like permease family protein n=1 Tax=Streptomyces sp. NRRL S-87 TaxID=1463920 RepID=UPI0004C03C85|nr:FtsX-like permease family protein [Streptomyces sp. NRRL S-87]
MTGFVFLRARAHRLLLTCALLTVLLTTAVLAALAAFTGSVGDTALRESLRGPAAGQAALVVSADVPPERRDAARAAVERAARRTFDGLPVTVRALSSSGPYELPRALQPAAARSGNPDLTQFAALDPTRVRLVAGALPGPPAAASGGRPAEIPAALPQTAARRLGLAPGTRLRLTDRVTGAPLTVRITGTYQARDTGDPYWQLDPLAGRAVRTLEFTTYGPLLADPAALAPGRTSTGPSGWLATADYRTLTTGRIGSLRAAAARGPEALRKEPDFASGATVRTALPAVLDRTERALVVARSTLLIVSLQLVLLAGYALLLVARLLSTQRAGETGLLRARGAARSRIAGLAVTEALLLAAPAALIAPLLSGPLTRLIGGYARTGGPERTGGALGTAPTASVWLVAAAAALCCAAAVVSPALAAAADGAVRLRAGRDGTLPAPLRAGADVGLVVIAAVAYWQLDRRTGPAGTAAAGSGLGVDPLLVAAPALALLAGTVLTLRLLPPLARLAERRAARSRGLGPALAGWHLARRPLRGAGPVLLLVLATATGTLAVGQGASWDRSQRDQADFAAGAAVRVLDGRPGGPGQAGVYAAWPGVRRAAPAHRTTADLSGGRTAAVLALGTGDADEGLLLRPDLADEPARDLLAALTPPRRTAAPEIRLPGDAATLALDLRLTTTPARRTAPPGDGPDPTRPPVLTVLAEDRYGLPYELSAGPLPADARPHRLLVDLDRTATGARHAPAGPLRLTGLLLSGSRPGGPPFTDGTGPRPAAPERHRLELTGLSTGTAGGTLRGLVPPAGVGWQAEIAAPRDGDLIAPGQPAATGSLPLVLGYDTGQVVDADDAYTVRLRTLRPAPAEPLPAVATDAFLTAAAARPGDRLDLTLAGERLTVRIVESVRALPTTGTPATGGPATGAPSEAPRADGGGLLLDLRTVNEVLTQRGRGTLAPTEWWLSTDRPTAVAAALRARPDAGAADDVLVRDERAAALLGDPLGRGPRAALLAVTAAAAALAAVGFAVSAAGSLREQSAELAVLRALGASRRRLAALAAAEHGLLALVGVLAGLGIGTVLTRAVVPLLVLTARAERPLPPVLVELPGTHLALLLAAVAAVPLLTAAALALRHAGPAPSLRNQGDS